MTELLAPGGSFASSIAALNHGADALYCGLESFSARKGAKNLSLDQLSRLIRYADEQKKRVYLAVNTLITDSQWPSLQELLHEALKLGPQAVILQDLGLLHYLKKYYPNQEIHASTQLAVHNAAGARELSKHGVSRAVLSRECSFNEIEAIRREVPQMELEVFIHGALCVSFSGLCFASGKMLGRSANRGECGQICRTWFNQGKDQGFYFSARDLELGKDILQLQNLGVHSLKIEGRMKGPEYAAYTSAYYRAILDKAPQESIDQWRQKSRMSFGREATSGWSKNIKGEKMIRRDYPGHSGIYLGEIDSGGLISLQKSLASRDGLLAIPPGKAMVTPQDTQLFSAQFSNPGKEKKTAHWAQEGQTIRLKQKLPQGSKVYQISGHDLLLPEVKEESYPPLRAKAEIHLEWRGDQIRIETSLAKGQEIMTFTVPQPFELAKNPGQLQKQWERLFLRSTGGPLEISRITWREGDWEGAFIPQSRLKEIRRQYRIHIEEALQQEPNVPMVPSGPANPSKLPDQALLCRRSQLSPQREELPFIRSFKDLQLSDLFTSGDRHYLPLNPILMDESGYRTELNSFLGQNSDEQFVLGLNNVGHLQIVDAHRKDERISFWVDYGLYCSNTWARDFYIENIPRLRGILFWIEADLKTNEPQGTSRSTDFTPPLFSSRVCFHRHSMAKGCPANCPREFSYDLEQNGVKYKALVKDCWTYLLK